ncbi:MAG TPA: helicase-associated domain-containing protein, partial [Ktedonobacterales bacterium]|nr:helicase-associated domain-containing protein [Ktedonobacterales bacterium]
VAFLEAHTQKALPQNVVYTMRDWARQYKESQAASGEKAWVIEARDEQVAGELVTSPKLRAFRLSRVGPRSVAAPPETSLRDLWRTLERLGYAQQLLSGVEELLAAAAGQFPTRVRRRRVSAATAGNAPVAG